MRGFLRTLSHLVARQLLVLSVVELVAAHGRTLRRDTISHPFPVDRTAAPVWREHVRRYPKDGRPFRKPSLLRNLYISGSISHDPTVSRKKAYTVPPGSSKHGTRRSGTQPDSIERRRPSTQSRDHRRSRRSRSVRDRRQRRNRDGFHDPLEDATVVSKHAAEGTIDVGCGGSDSPDRWRTSTSSTGTAFPPRVSEHADRPRRVRRSRTIATHHRPTRSRSDDGHRAKSTARCVDTRTRREPSVPSEDTGTSHLVSAESSSGPLPVSFDASVTRTDTVYRP